MQILLHSVLFFRHKYKEKSHGTHGQSLNAATQNVRWQQRKRRTRFSDRYGDGFGEQQGGVGNLINQLQQGGLGDTLSSWVSNQSSNLPVSGTDLQNALGSDTVNQIAQKFGVDAGQAGDLLAKVLPDLVDKATPNGTAQDADGFGLDDIASMLLKNFMK